MNRRTALALLTGASLAGCRRASTGHRTIRVVVAPNISATPLYLADELGLFADDGLDIAIQVISESLQMVPLVAAGRADVAFSSVTPAEINIVAKGGRVRVVAARDAAVLGCTHEVHGRRGSFPNGFVHAAELKGKRVAVTAATSLTAFILDLMLESAGLRTADVDRCELVNPSSGLGSLIWLAWQTFATERLYVTIIATALLGSGLHTGLGMLERRLVPWKAPHAG